MKNLFFLILLVSTSSFAKRSEINCTGVDSTNRSLSIKIQEDSLVVSYTNGGLGTNGQKPDYTIYKYNDYFHVSEFYAIQNSNTPLFQFHIKIVISKQYGGYSYAEFFTDGKYDLFKKRGSAKIVCK